MEKCSLKNEVHVLFQLMNIISQLKQILHGVMYHKPLWSYVRDKIGFQVLARRIQLWQGFHSRLECLGRALFVGMAL